jgi:lycopene beta-cyclase
MGLVTNVLMDGIETFLLCTAQLRIVRKVYDLIIAGGGVSGLSMVYHLICSPLQNHTVLVVDKDIKNWNDRTLSFWTDQPTLFDEIVFRSWNTLRFVGDDSYVVDLGAWRYATIRGIDFYKFVHKRISAHQNIHFLQGRVELIDDYPEQASISVDGKIYTGRWVFDSRFSLPNFKVDLTRYQFLKMCFLGWLIESPYEICNPQVATPFDFRVPQRNGMCFFYVLPYTERTLLVEYIQLNSEIEPEVIKTYIENVLGIQKYQILEQEEGIIPLTDQPFPRRIGNSIMAIGTLGGRIKSCSGYAFTRIQEDSSAIIKSLMQEGHPFNVPRCPGRYRFYDALLLQVMKHHGKQIKPIFSAMIKNNSIDQVFRFLDEKTTKWEDIQMISSFPPAYFLQSLIRMKVLNRL